MVQQTNKNSKQPIEHIVVNCPQCDGTGDCSTCQGDGGMCPFCEGLGACRRCQGSGRVNELSDSEWVGEIVNALNNDEGYVRAAELNSVMVAKWRRRLTNALDKIGQDLDALVAYDMAFNHLVTIMADVAVGLQPHPNMFAQAWARLRAAERDVLLRMKPAAARHKEHREQQIDDIASGRTVYERDPIIENLDPDPAKFEGPATADPRPYDQSCLDDPWGEYDELVESED